MARNQLTIWSALPIGILCGLATACFPTAAVHAGTAIPSGATVTIDAHGICKKVTNPGSGTRMVFAGSADEWANFRSNPNGLTMNECAPACGGKLVGGYCWYLGRNTSNWEIGGESCNEACAGRGGCNLAGTRNYAGSGGTNGQCAQVLSALLGRQIHFAGTYETMSTGCGLNPHTGLAERSTTSTTCHNNYIQWYHRVCACNK